jgi:hypothetical protein
MQNGQLLAADVSEPMSAVRCYDSLVAEYTSCDPIGKPSPPLAIYGKVTRGQRNLDHSQTEILQEGASFR